jgi:uncharacterized protein (DUF2147 family)
MAPASAATDACVAAQLASMAARRVSTADAFSAAKAADADAAAAEEPPGRAATGDGAEDGFSTGGCARERKGSRAARQRGRPKEKIRRERPLLGVRGANAGRWLRRACEA